MSRVTVDRPSVVVSGQRSAADADEREAALTQSAPVETEPSREDQPRRSVRTSVSAPPKAARPAARQPRQRGAGSAAPGIVGAPPLIPLGAPVAGSAPLAAGPDPMVWADAVPDAAPSLQALQAISGQFGTGSAVAAPASPMLTNRGGTPEAIRWGITGANYQELEGKRLRQADVLANVDTELGRILSGAADSANLGRAKIDAIIADLNASLTALGPIRDTAQGRAMVHDALMTALERAGVALEEAQHAASVTGQELSAIVDRYVSEYGQPPPAPAYMGAARGGIHGAMSGGPPGQVPAGEVGGWIDQALQTLAQNGHDVSRIDPSAVAAIIAHESGGNPNAINLWDSNAAAGIPSKGLMQTIDPTFNAHALPGHQNIWNPVDNIMAGIRYAEDRYGSVDNVPGIVAMRSGGGYVGY
jgi:hypothetical protein